MAFKLAVEIDREEDGRWIADVVDLPGVVAYGNSRAQAISRAEASALRVLADWIEADESADETMDVRFAVA
jgi:predicted RNase H-like HicB family nuclease